MYLLTSYGYTIVIIAWVIFRSSTIITYYILVTTKALCLFTDGVFKYVSENTDIIRKNKKWSNIIPSKSWKRWWSSRIRFLNFRFWIERKIRTLVVNYLNFATVNFFNTQRFEWWETATVLLHTFPMIMFDTDHILSEKLKRSLKIQQKHIVKKQTKNKNFN